MLTFAALNGVGVGVGPDGGPKYSARMDPVCPETSPLASGTPSKFVVLNPFDNCTVAGSVSPKNGGKDCIVNVLGGAEPLTLPVTRVKRRYTKSTLAAA
jgi:hypothetical protein